MALVVSKSQSSGSVNREERCPFLLRVFCATTRHNPILDYNRGNVPANELQMYTWPDATLKELTTLVQEVKPDTRKRGTLMDFAIVFPHTGARSQQHFSTRDIGTTVAGQKGPDDTKTLAQARFVIGDYVDIAITPPNARGGNEGRRFERAPNRDRFGGNDRFGGPDRYGGNDRFGGTDRYGGNDRFRGSGRFGGGRGGGDRYGQGGNRRFRPY